MGLTTVQVDSYSIDVLLTVRSLTPYEVTRTLLNSLTCPLLETSGPFS